MNDAETLRFMWRYMIYADQQIMAAARTLSDEGYDRKQNMSWGSVHKLLAHALTAQRVWLERLRGHVMVYPNDPPPPREQLESVWGEIHQGLLAFAEVQTTETLQNTIRSRNRSGVEFEMPVWSVMHHVADHATYHRGQLNSMIKLAGGQPSAVMLYTYCIENGYGKQI